MIYIINISDHHFNAFLINTQIVSIFYRSNHDWHGTWVCDDEAHGRSTPLFLSAVRCVSSPQHQHYPADNITFHYSNVNTLNQDLKASKLISGKECALLLFFSILLIRASNWGPQLSFLSLVPDASWVGTNHHVSKSPSCVFATVDLSTPTWA